MPFHAYVTLTLSRISTQSQRICTSNNSGYSCAQVPIRPSIPILPVKKTSHPIPDGKRNPDLLSHPEDQDYPSDISFHIPIHDVM